MQAFLKTKQHSSLLIIKKSKSCCKKGEIRFCIKTIFGIIWKKIQQQVRGVSTREEISMIARIIAIFLVSWLACLFAACNSESVSLPPYHIEWSDKIVGGNEVRVENPNNTGVSVGLRARVGGSGKDFYVPAYGTKSIYAPDGAYDIYFIYSSDPSALYQGDGFALADNGVRIRLIKVVGGNYGLRRIK